MIDPGQKVPEENEEVNTGTPILFRIGANVSPRVVELELTPLRDAARARDATLSGEIAQLGTLSRGIRRQVDHDPTPRLLKWVLFATPESCPSCALEKSNF